MNKRKIIHDLIIQVLHVPESYDITKFLNISNTLLSAQIPSNSPKTINFWERKWKKYCYSNQFQYICLQIPQIPLSILTIFDQLKFSSPLSTLSNTKSSQKFTKRSIEYLSEQEITSDLLTLLQGGSGQKLTFLDSKFSTNGYNLALSHFSIVSKLCRVVYCNYYVNLISQQLHGIVGQSISEILQKERQEFQLQLALLRSPESTLLSLYSYVMNLSSFSRIEACSILCSFLENNPEISPIDSLHPSQLHGNPIVKSIGLTLINSVIGALVDFIRDWTVYGILDDPYNEFFIRENTEPIEQWEWWNSKYLVISEKIPEFLGEESLIAKIVASGRAWCFVRTFCSNYSSYLFSSSNKIQINNNKDSFTSHFPEFANQNLEFISSDEENFNNISGSELLLKTEGVWNSKNGEKFDIPMVNYYAQEAMKNAMNLLMKFVWVPGNLQTIYSFLLFNRGDLALELYRSCFTSVKGGVTSVLHRSLHQLIDNYRASINPITKENLTHRIDISIDKVPEEEIDPLEISLTYNIDSPLDMVCDPKSMRNYKQLSQLLWRLKCCEFRLNACWKRARLPSFLAEVQEVGFDRLQNGMRHTMIITIRAINEFLSTDVVLSGHHQLLADLDKAEDIDSVLKIHQVHMNHLMKNTLLTKTFSKQRKALFEMIQIIFQYNDLEDELENLNDDLVNKMLNDSISDQGNDAIAFIDQMRKNLSDLTYQLKDVYDDFNQKLLDLYYLIHESDDSMELQRLKFRLLFCIPRNRLQPQS